MIGKRTWGGLVRASGPPSLMDGGGVTAPNGAVYGLNGEWEVENVGVAPDIEVEYDPAIWRQGRDAQLEKAVEWVLAEIEEKSAEGLQKTGLSELPQEYWIGKAIVDSR